MRHIKAPDVEPGDWVCFRYQGNLVIGEVKYVICPNYYTEAVTSAGTVQLDSILEVRKK